MPNSETQSGNEYAGQEVLTLPEAAAYLRVPEDALLKLVSKRAIPAQSIDGEWRFLKQALADWLRLGGWFPSDLRQFPHLWMLEHPFWEEFLRMLADRFIAQLKPPKQKTAQRGSKEAVLMHFGAFKDDADLDQQLANMRAIREGGK